MSRPNSLGDFDVVTGPAAPVRPIAPATQSPSPASDRPSAAHKPGARIAPSSGRVEPPAS
jgi:hypothetical protein